ncbi:MAG: SDR family oxidoreductase [Moraxellaceae bacterium]|nr:SDR family oxidoreductase [Moraxellaceae bacterium]
MAVKTVLITGGNSGIGKATALALARQGYRVFIAARDMAKSKAALADITTAVPGAQVMALKLDLADLDQVRVFADDFRRRVPVLDVLLLNAGLFPLKRQMTVQGFEQQFGVNHLGHFLLTHLLLDTVRAADAGRIVVVSSIMHWLGRINFGSFRGETRYNPVVAYGQSKLANVLFMQELSRRLAGEGIAVNALHPGGVDTGIARDLPAFAQKIYAMATVTVEKGAESSVFLASSEAASEMHGRFVRNCKPMRVSPLATRATAEKLWRVSADLCGLPTEGSV